MAMDSGQLESNKKNKKQLNIWIILCCMIILYLVVNFCIYFFTGRTEIYEVSQGATASKFEGQYNALILRDETVVNSAGSGYISFFVGDATSIRVGQQTYVVDGSGEISTMLEQAAKDQSILSPENLSKIRNSIFEFDTSFNENSYFALYNLKYKIDSQILELINGNVFNNINSTISNLTEGSYKIVSSDISGIMLHSIDGFEGKTVDDIESSSFNKSLYKKTIIKTNDLVEESSPIYKVVTSDQWKLIIQINNPDAFKDINNVDIEFLKDNVKANADFTMFTKSGNTYGVLTLDKYLIRYVTERFVPISLIDKTQQGYKIPKTSITEKQFYQIPKEFLTQGGNSSNWGFNKQVTLEDGSTSINFVEVAIVKSTDDSCYVSTDYFTDGDLIIKNDSDSKYQVGKKENLKGVFASNGGYAKFKYTDIIGENNSFYIINPSTSQVKLFDQIVKDASKISENEIINR